MTEPKPVAPRKPGALESLAKAMTSWRTASVTLLSFSSGMPLGLVITAIPDWMRSSGVDIRVVGLITLAQAPWSFKILWSPLMDRYSLPRLGRRRGWVALAQVVLFALSLALAGLGHHPEAPWVVGALALAIAFASATHDIAYDAYAVDVLRPEEQGIAAGARTAVYRVAWSIAGGLSITIAGAWSWPVANLLVALLYLPTLLVAIKAPEPLDVPPAPSSLREAIWLPFVGFLGRHRALEILAFVFFYKFADNLAVALLRPFLVDMGYSDFDRGVALATVGMFGVLLGTLIGGIMTTTMGLGHSLWAFGALQIFSNLGYVLVARSGVDRALMYAATGFDMIAQGLGSGAFAVLLLRMTQKRFSATQYALFSSLFGLPRIIAGPVSGFAVDAIGWEAYFWSTLLAGVPGMVLLHRFAPLGTREPRFEVEPPKEVRSLSRPELVGRGLVGAAAGLALASLSVSALGALKTMRARPDIGFDLAFELAALVSPGDIGGWLQSTGVLLFAVFTGLCTAGVFAARRGAGGEIPGQ